MNTVKRALGWAVLVAAAPLLLVVWGVALAITAVISEDRLTAQTSSQLSPGHKFE